MGHKVRKYKGYHSVCPFVGIGTLPTPLSPAIVPLPPEPGRGGAHSPAGEGLGESQFRRLEKKISTVYSVPWGKPRWFLCWAEDTTSAWTLSSSRSSSPLSGRRILSRWLSVFEHTVPSVNLLPQLLARALCYFVIFVSWFCTSSNQAV